MREVAGGVKAAPSDRELERTIESVPGVANATVERRPDGRSRLRLRLHPDQDAESVSWAVAATLRERFAIALDPAAIRPVTAPSTGTSDHAQADDELPDPPAPGAPPPAPPAPPAHDRPDPAAAAAQIDGDEGGGPPAAEEADDAEHAASAEDDHAEHGATAEADDPELAVDDWPQHGELDPVRVVREGSEPTNGHVTGEATAAASRAAISHLEVHRTDTDVRVTARLEHDGRHGEGTRRAVLTGSGIGRAIAEATVDALRMLVDSPLLVGIDHVSVRHAAEPPTATVVLTLLSGRSEDTLIGAALLGGDPDGAVMRATLDALNRRVEPLLATTSPVS